VLLLLYTFIVDKPKISAGNQTTNFKYTIECT
jgi:hypothetical protein